MGKPGSFAHTRAHTHPHLFAPSCSRAPVCGCSRLRVCSHHPRQLARTHSRTHSLGASLVQKQAPTTARTRTPAHTPTYTVPCLLSVHTQPLSLACTLSPAPSPSCTQMHSHTLTRSWAAGRAPSAQGLVTRKGCATSTPRPQVPDPLSTLQA